MTLSQPLVERIGECLRADLRRAAPGHCLRVDHLTYGDAIALCQSIEQDAEPTNDIQASVLDTEGLPPYGLRPEQAIEVRNRKHMRLCLFVPAGSGDAAASSLQNAFGEWNLDAALDGIASELLRSLPDDLRPASLAVREQLRRPLRASSERWADYLASVADGPTEARAGMELWRVGLIPDAESVGFAERLADNRRSTVALVHAARPQSSLTERLNDIGLRPGPVRDALMRYLANHTLRDARGWQRGMTEPPQRGAVTFERWAFERPEGADLEMIEVHPLLDAAGLVDAKTGLMQPGGPGTQPIAVAGAKRKVTVRWRSVPSKVTSASRWRAQLIPAVGEYSAEEEAEAELPDATAAAKSRRVSIPLSLDLVSTPVRAVQIRIVALDEHGAELREAQTGNIVAGLSTEFWLESETEESDTSSTARVRVAGVQNRPLARLRAAMELDDEIVEPAGQWSEGDIDVYQFTLNGRLTSRLLVPRVLRRLEECRIADDTHLAFEANIEAGDRLTADGITPIEVPLLGEEYDRLQLRRRDFMRRLRAQDHRGLVAVADWSPELARAARAYAAAFREALSSASTGAALGLFRLDTLSLTIAHPRGAETAILTLPTHPLRLLWYSAYCELLHHWEEALAGIGRAERFRHLDLDIVERVAPLNVPALLPTADGTFLFSQNLSFFWGLLLPLAARDPARRIADLAAAIGLEPEDALMADLPPERLAAELRAYQDVHPYLATLRLNVLNPGGGAFLAAALRELTGSIDASEDDSGRRSPSLDLLLHSHRPLPLSIPPIEDLQRDLYERRSVGDQHHLVPLCGVALRPIEDAAQLPGGDVNVAVAFDAFEPQAIAVPDADERDSLSFYGLLLRLLPTFQPSDGNARWEYHLAIPPTAARERHPVTPGYTNEIADTHRAWLRRAATAIAPESERDAVPALVAELDPNQRTLLDALHEQSDWVIFLDRFLGVDFFDFPRDPDLSRVASRYLLDYSPEFLEGLGHRMLVTTAHREEVGEILGRAMHELGFAIVEESVGEVLRHLKTISGRLALRVVGDTSRAREAVSLGVVAAYLRARGELDDAILIPVDAHPEIFGLWARRAQATPRARCDLMRIRFQRGRLVVTFIEVKSRAAAGQSEELANRIVDQIEATEQVMRDLFFRRDPRRLDHVLQRSRLASVLRFYLQRAWRHGLISSEQSRDEHESAIARLETGIPDMRVDRRGFIVNLAAHPEPSLRIRDSTIQLITARDVAELGMATEVPRDEDSRGAEGAVAIDDSTTEHKNDAGAGDPTGPQSGDGRESVDAAHDLDAAAREHQADLKGDEEVARGPSASAAPEKAPSVAEVLEPSAGDSGVRLDAPPVEEAPKPSPGESVSRLEITAVLGQTPVDQTDVVWRASVRGSPHLFILGIPGQGKSWTVTRLLLELTRQGVPALVFDFHGQFSDPESRYARAASPAVLDAAQGLPFSPFEAETAREAGTSFWQTNAFVVAEIFEYVCGLGDIQRDVVYEAIRDCYQSVGFGSGDPRRLPTIAEVASRLQELEEERRVRNVVPRCRPLLEFGLFSDEETGVGVGQERFADLIRRGAVLDVSRQGLEELQLAAGAFVLRKIYKEMFRWGETDRIQLVLVLDEAHRLARDITLPKIMKEGRKFGIAVVVASQGLADFHTDVVGNAGTKVIFRTNFPMSKKVGGFLRAPARVDLATAIEQLSVGEAYVQTPEMSTAARVRMTPLVE